MQSRDARRCAQQPLILFTEHASRPPCLTPSVRCRRNKAAWHRVISSIRKRRQGKQGCWKGYVGKHSQEPPHEKSGACEHEQTLIKLPGMLFQGQGTIAEYEILASRKARQCKQERWKGCTAISHLTERQAVCKHDKKA